MSTVDGQSSYWGRERRTIHIDVFRGVSLHHHHPQLLQSLPAKLQADLEHRPGFVALNTEIESLSAKATVATTDDERKQARDRRNELYWQRRQLVVAELRKCQKNQPLNLATADGIDSFIRPLTYFDRVRFLDPSRDRLASSLSLNVPLRSEEGRASLHDLITLCKENPEVGYRPSLQPKMGRCPVAEWACKWIEILESANSYKSAVHMIDTFARSLYSYEQIVRTNTMFVRTFVRILGSHEHGLHM
ncbi:MAG: hypothetical protein M1839_001760 [Geoglossum umbratile]|nr:MAG: hypothetical protein M1839_001760 [Geoglossum umbratile]